MSAEHPAASSSGREVSGEGPMISRPDSPAAEIRDNNGHIHPPGHFCGSNCPKHKPREHPAATPSRGQTAMRESVSCPRMTRAEVGVIVNAAKALIEAHGRRSPTSEHSTLGEDGALWELNFQLGTYRQRKGMSQ